MADIWNLNDILQGKTDDELIQELELLVSEFEKHRVDLQPDIDPKLLLSIIQLKERIGIIASRINAYYYFVFSDNTSDPKILGRITRFDQISNSLTNRMIFFGIWFMYLDDNNTDRLINSVELKEYYYFFKRLRIMKKYTLDEEKEKIINLKSSAEDSLSSLYSIICSGFTYEIDKETYSQEQLTSWYTSNDKDKRVKAYNMVLSRYKEYSTVLTEIYKAIVMDWHNEGILIRGHTSPISQRNVGNDVTDKSVVALLSVIRKNTNVFQEYFKLKYEISKKDYPYSRFHLYAPINMKEQEYDYESSKRMVLGLFKEFDPRFEKAARRIFDKDHVHVYPKKGKKGGAYCYTVSRSIDPYILLNHNNRLRDVFTLAHELGHAIHSILAEDKPDILQHATLPLAETASIFSELLLSNQMLDNAKDNNEKISIITRMLDDQYASIIRQAYFVLFEEYAHDRIKEGATLQELEDKWLELLKEQFGDMDIPDIFRNEWNYIPHIHHSPFYCYAYSWGNLLVLALYEDYLENKDDFIEKYIKILSYGGSRPPLEILIEAGYNPEEEEFWEKGFEVIRRQVDELKELIK
ncbi:MAG: M3 family oligoendopeptidase [Candidatus Woesearchaeota archaeon]